MEIQPDFVISSDSFEKYGLNERCQTSKERVEDFLNRGLMSQACVYQRFTETLSDKLTSLKRAHQPAVIQDIRQSFRRLCDPDNGYVSEAEFTRLVSEKLGAASQNAAALLFRICSWHAFYPFPPAPNHNNINSKPLIDEDGFVRAICLLTLSPFPPRDSNFSIPSHRWSSGTWGPHRGWYIATRGKEPADFRRRLFRSFAVPVSASSNSNSGQHGTKRPVPRFMWFADKESDQQVLVTEDEPELSIDIVDVLSECPPEEDKMTANPFRESYRLVLPSLPKSTDDLAGLYVPQTRVVALVHLVQQHVRESADLVAAVGDLGGEEISWERFDAVMSEHSECIADGLCNIFGALVAT